MLENKDQLKFLRLERYRLFQDNLNKVGIPFSELEKILKRLQFFLFDFRFSRVSPVISERNINALKKFFLRLNLLEQKLFDFYNTEKDNELYLDALSTLATFYEFGAEILSERDYLIRSMVVYCLSEYESNSQLIWEKLIKKDEKLQMVQFFDVNAENRRADVEPIDLIIFFILSFFGRNFLELKKNFSRNYSFIQGEQLLTDWIYLFRQLINFLDSGNSIDENLFQKLFSNIKQKASSVGVSIYFWLIKRFEALIKEFSENSIWQLHTLFPEIPQDFIQILLKEQKYDLWKSQKESLDYIKDLTQNLVLRMPTSAGKTLIAEIQILRHIFLLKKKIIYVCPTNSLINQVFVDFRVHFDKLGLNIAPLGGSYENINTFDNFLLKKASLIILTPEKLDMLFRKKGGPFLEDFSLIILDEFQLIEDSSRGAKYELLISRINEKIIRQNLKLTFILLSACIPNSNIVPILEWLGSNRTKAFYSDWKPTRLVEGLFWLDPNGNTLYINLLNMNIISMGYNNNDKSAKQQILELLKRMLFQFQPIMIFCERKDLCEDIIRSIYESRNSYNLPELSDERIQLAVDLVNKEIGTKNELTEFIKFGLAFHHSGLSPKIRLVIESLIKTNIVKIFSCTTTFAQGVNFPVRSIIFHSMYLYDDDTGKNELIPAKLYLNIIGRAGRALKFGEGTVLLADKKQKYFSLINSDLISTLSALKDFDLQDLNAHLEEKLMQDDVLSSLHVDLLAENVNNMNLNNYIANTYLSRIDPDCKSLLPYLNIQKQYIEKNYALLPDLLNIFCESGLTIPFCKKLNDYLIKEKIIEQFNHAMMNNKVPTKCDAFKKVNVWIFRNFSKLAYPGNKDPDLLDKWVDHNRELLDKWVNRIDNNYKDIVENCPTQKEAFENIRIVNSLLDYYFPWIWSFILRLIFRENNKLRRYLWRIPDFLKFGANSINKLIDIVYENNKSLLVDGKILSKNQFAEIIQQDN